MRLEPGHSASGSTVGSSVSGPVTQGTTGMGPPESFGGWDWWQDHGQAEQELSSWGDRGATRSTAGPLLKGQPPESSLPS